jgi:hypothetical protein
MEEKKVLTTCVSDSFGTYQLPFYSVLRLYTEIEPHPADQFSADDFRKDIRYLPGDDKNTERRKAHKRLMVDGSMGNETEIKVADINLFFNISLQSE